MAPFATGYAVRLGWLREALEGERASREAGDDANARMVASLGRGGVAELRRQRGDVAALIRRLTPELLAHRVTRSDGRVARLGDALGEFSSHDVAHTAELRAS